MKALLVVCFVLPHVIVGSIFRQQEPRLSGYTVQPQQGRIATQPQRDDVIAQFITQPDSAEPIFTAIRKNDYSSSGSQESGDATKLHQKPQQNDKYSSSQESNQQGDSSQQRISKEEQKNFNEQLNSSQQQISQEVQQTQKRKYSNQQSGSQQQNSSEQKYSQQKSSSEQNFSEQKSSSEQQTSSQQKNSNEQQHYKQQKKYHNKQSSSQQKDSSEQQYSSQENQSKEKNSNQKYNNKEHNNKDQKKDRKNQYKNKYEQEQQKNRKKQMNGTQQKRSSERSSQESDEKQRQYQKQYMKKHQGEQKQRPQKATKYQGSSSQQDSQSSEEYQMQRKGMKHQYKMQPQAADKIQWKALSMAIGADVPATKQDIEDIFGDAYATLRVSSEQEKQQFHQQYQPSQQYAHAQPDVNATQQLRANGYQVEEHSATTDDGYVLSLIRIRPSKMAANKAPVLLMHDFLGSADDWLLLGPSKALAYMLADAGHEVWLGSARGSRYSRHHVTKHPALAEFWQYSMDEVALQDLPALIETALRVSGAPRLHLVGHGSGAAAYLALAARRPRYQDKVIDMHALAPTAYMKNAASPLLRMIAPTKGKMAQRIRRALGDAAFRPTKELVRTAGGDMVRKAIGSSVADEVRFVMGGVDAQQLNPATIASMMRTMRHGSGASVRQVLQLAQAQASGQFAMFDFGAESNERVYGQSAPPTYRMDKVSTPVTLVYAQGDWMAAPQDVQRLQRMLPRATAQPVPQPLGHMAFQVGVAAPQLNARIVDEIAIASAATPAAPNARAPYWAQPSPLTQ